jgi:hypothetical protein
MELALQPGETSRREKPAPVHLQAHRRSSYMSELHKTMLENAEEKVLTGYLAGLKVARDDISHVSSATVNVLQGWIDDVEAKLAAGKSSDGSAAGGSGPSADGKPSANDPGKAAA